MNHLLALRIAYDGTDLHGCPIVVGQRTVCGLIAVALARVGAAPTFIEALSRTDAGVHATGNVIVVTPGRRLTPGQALLLLDRHLPPDLRCIGAAAVPAIPIAGLKTYRYLLDLSPWGDPLRARVAWRPGPALHPDRLPDLATALPGAHDFIAFHRSSDARPPRVRRIAQACWALDGDSATFTVRGEGFGYRLVRGLVGGMVAVGLGACPPEDWFRALQGIPTHASRQTAPAHGLCLISVEVDAGWQTAR